MLPKCNILSSGSVNISKVLYDISGEKQYLDVLFLNYKKAKYDLGIVSIIARCRPNEYVYQKLVDIYVNNEDSTIRSTALDGILYNRRKRNVRNSKVYFCRSSIRKKGIMIAILAAVCGGVFVVIQLNR